MNVEQIKHLYEYHFTRNKKLLDYCTENLSDLEFNEMMNVAIGSLSSLFVHIMDTDERWFSGLRGLDDPGRRDFDRFSSVDEIRKNWEKIEKDMKDYLGNLTDSDLLKEFEGPMQVWHVLMHVINHGTHHRAQIIAILRELGIDPIPQDYIFFVMGRI